MLVLSRRLQEKLYFPGIRLIVHVLSIRRGAVRLGIEAPPEVIVLREDVQALPMAGQLLDTESDRSGRDVMVRGVGQVLRVASDGLEMALLQLEAGRTRDAKELLDTVQGHLGWLQWRLRCGRREAAPICPREGA